MVSVLDINGIYYSESEGLTLLQINPCRSSKTQCYFLTKHKRKMENANANTAFDKM